MHARGAVVGAVVVAVVFAVARAGAAEPKPIVVEVNSSYHLRLGQNISRVSVGAGDVADVAAFPPDQVLVTGKRIGQTSVTVWFRNDEVQIYMIRVEHPIRHINDALVRAIPDGKDLRVQPAGNNVILTGLVPTVADIEHAEQIVKGYATAEGAQIVNLLNVAGDNQVQLEVSFAEVSRSALKEVGLNFWARDQGTQWTGGLLNPGSTPSGIIPALQQPNATDNLNLAGGMPIITSPLGATFGAVFSTAAGSKFPFSAALSVLSQRGYARTLSEPTLVALSGQTATFLAGGEFPVPMPQALGTVGVDYKKFGVQLSFTPTVVGQTIQLKMAATVSDIDFSLGLRLASVTVPGLTSRYSDTTVRLKDGESFAIAGLLSDKVRSSVDKVPGLGDLPVLGMLFRSTSYRREETELLVVVTAHLVRAQGDRPAVPGEDTLSDPSDLELFLLGTIESKEGRDPSRPKKKPSGKVGFAR
jgi:pilus assembly protein CpaC